jgi:hypothetical protein
MYRPNETARVQFIAVQKVSPRGYLPPPRCRRSDAHPLIAPRTVFVGALGELRRFQCPICRHVITRSVR